MNWQVIFGGEKGGSPTRLARFIRGILGEFLCEIRREFRQTFIRILRKFELKSGIKYDHF